MSQMLTLRFTPNQDDYAKVLRSFFWQRTGTRISLVLLVIAFALVVYVVLSKGSPPTIFELIWLLVPPAFIVFSFFIQPQRLARQAAQNEQLVTEATWEVGDGGVKISSRFGNSQMEWETLKKLVAAGEYYFLLSKTNANAFRFLPRRAFTSPDQEQQFVQLVRDHLSAK